MKLKDKLPNMSEDEQYALLATDGLLVVEINEALADETAELFRTCGFSPTIHDDFRGKHRWISADGAGARRGE